MRNGQTKGLLLFCLIFIKGCLAGDDIIVSERVRARLGQSASLYCKVNEELHVTLFEWSRCNDSSFIAVLNPALGSHIKEPYIGHVSISDYHNLTITQVQDRDYGEYCCKVTTFPKGSLVGRVLLLKDEEKNEEVDEPRGPPAGLPVMMIVYITCGVLGFVILTAIITVVCNKRRDLQNPVHVTVTHNSPSPKQPSVLLKDSHTPSHTPRRDDEDEDDDDDMYLNIKASEP